MLSHAFHALPVSVGALLLLSALCAVPARAQEIISLDRMETADQWEGKGVTISISPDCVEGNGALKLSGSGHARLNPAALRGIDVSRFDRLLMRVKIIDGQVTDFGVATRGFPQTGLDNPRWAEYDESTPAGVWLDYSVDLHLCEWGGGGSDFFGTDSPALSLLYTPGKRNSGVLVDDLRLVKDPVRIAYDWVHPVRPLRIITEGKTTSYENTVELENVSGAPLEVTMRFSDASLKKFTGRIQPTEIMLKPGEKRAVVARIDVPPALKPLEYELQVIEVIPARDARFIQRIEMLTAAPFPPVAHPFTVKNVRPGTAAPALLDRYPTDHLPKYPCVWMSQSALNTNGSCADGHAGQSPDGFDRLKCNTCGKVTAGTATTGGIFHRLLIDYAGELGLAYQRTKDIRYAQKARELFLTYAREYHKYPLGQPISQASSYLAPNNATYVLGSVVMAPMTRALDLIWDSGALSDADKSAIAEGFIWPAALEMMKIHPGLTNMQDAMNDALFNAGVLLNDPNLTAVALFGSHGLQAKIGSVFDDDGATPESISSGYHSAALNPVLRQVASVVNAGLPVEIQFDRLEKAKKLMALLRMPDGRIPNRGDSATPAGSPDAALASYGSQSFQHYGFTILRDGEGSDALYVALDHRPPSETHSHRDKLSIIFYGMGQDFGCDEGSLYNMDTSKQNTLPNWSRRASWGGDSLVHSTITVDQETQQFCGGKLLYFHGAKGDYQAMAASTNSAYQGVTLERNIILLGGVMVTVDRGLSDTPRTYDWTHHSHGDLGFPTALQPVEKLGNGIYAIPENPVWGKLAGNATFLWKREKASCMLTILGDAKSPAEYGAAMGWANLAYQQARIEAPFVLARRQGKTANFVTVFEPFKGETPAVTNITRLPVTANGKTVGDDQAIALKVDKANETLYFLVNLTPGEKAVGPIRTAERCFALRVAK